MSAVVVLGEILLQARGSSAEIRVYEILYYKLATSHALEVCGALVNLVLFEFSRKFDPTFDLAEIRGRIASLEMTTTAATKWIFGEVNTALNALTSEDALGKLGIVVPLGNSRYRVNSYRPDWRSAAYILYESWPENVSRVRTAEVINGHDGLGRLFFLTEPEVMALLARLEQERAVTLEQIADLNQIGLNPAMTAGDFLEMLVDDEP